MKETSIYRRLSILFSKGIHINDILDALDIKNIYLYGVGGLGQIVISDMKNTTYIASIYDKNVNDNSSFLINGKEVRVFSPNMIPEDDVPILITPVAYGCEIIDELIGYGIKKKRLLTLNILLEYGMYYFIDLKVNKLGKENFLIVGANFDNKGSQAMTYVTINELRNRFADPCIWFLMCPWESMYDEKKYKMLVIKDGWYEGSTFCELLPRLDGIIDISGYALTSIKGFSGVEGQLSLLRKAFDYEVDYYMMPQSFGPLDFPEYELAEIKSLLSYVRIIYARENSGYELLTAKMGLKNVQKSYDLVLQNKCVNIENIYCDQRKTLDVQVEKNSVAFVPNANLSIYISIEKLIEIYQLIIDYLIEQNKYVWIIPHSNDEEICGMIYELYRQNNRVKYYKEKMDCIGFEEVIAKFDYVIASRYHAIIHAYKQRIPCVIFGWADKYIELSADFGQDEYVIDVRRFAEKDNIINIVEHMNKEFEIEKSIINDKIDNYQSDNCFDII